MLKRIVGARDMENEMYAKSNEYIYWSSIYNV